MKILYSILLWPLNIFAQEAKGIHFERALTFDQVVSKAKLENKFIFVECFATWCTPCKKMEKEVFPKENVGSFFNSKFVSLKLQMDTSAGDDEATRSRYQDAQDIRTQFAVSAIPSYLFFSPEGEIIHKGTGALDDSGIIRLATQALDTTKQYYSLKRKFEKKELGYDLMAFLARKAKSLKEIELANSVAAYYKSNFLDQLPLDSLCTREYFEFAAQFPAVVKSSDSFFYLCSQYPQRVDSVMKGYGNFSEWMVNNTITHEEINGSIWIDGKPVSNDPDWRKMNRAISLKYGAKKAIDLITESQIVYYDRRKDWRSFAKAVEKKRKMHPPKSQGKQFGGSFGDAFGLNLYAWEIFSHCSDKNILRKALTWSNLSIRLDQPNPNVQFLDTKANLLYKLGRKKEAMYWEKEALNKEPNKGGVVYKIFSETLEKMEKNLPTWKN